MFEEPDELFEPLKLELSVDIETFLFILFKLIINLIYSSIK